MVSLRLAVCVVALVVAVQAGRVPREEKYTTKYDNINVDDILKSDRLLNNYINCLLDKGKCTPDGLELKKNLPDALTNECAKCSEIQRRGADQVLRFLIKKKPAIWEQLEKKYDQNGVYRAKYDKEFAEIKGQ